MSNEETPLIKGVKSDILQDPSSDIPGFIASELRENEEELLYDTREEEENDISAPVLSRTRIHIIFFSMVVGIFLASLDGTVVTTLLGEMASEFDAIPKISWIASAYLVSCATFQPLYGKLSDIFGRRPLLLFSNVTFSLGCFLCYLSPNVTVLIIGRFVSGIGGGGLTALSSITMSDMVPLKERGVYQGMGNVGFGLGTAVGAIVGGFFAVHPNLGGWRGAFLSQVPLSLVSTVLIHVFLVLPDGSSGLGVKGSDIKKKLKLIDWLGASSLVSFLMLFLIGSSIVGNNEVTWAFLLNFKAFSLVLATSISLLYFIKAELSVDTPILPLTFLKISSVAGVALANFFYCITQFTLYYYVPVYFSTVLNLNPNEIGHRFAPTFFAIIIGSLGSGFYMKSTGKYYHLLVFAGLLAMAGTLKVYVMTPSVSVVEQYILLLIPVVGLAVIVTATLLALIAAVPHEHQAATTSISYLFRSCGATIGVSVGSAIFSKKLNIELNRQVLKFLDKGHSSEELRKIIYKALHSSNYVQNSAPEFVKETLVDCYSAGTKSVFLFSIISCFLGFLSLLLIKEYTLHSSLNRK